MNKETLEKPCTCTDECLGYLTKTCKRLEQPDYTALLQPVGTKQETLEEASYNYARDKMNRTSHLIGFREGAKWQQERSYSEEEFLAFGKSCFYKGFEKSEKDDANCYTAFREEVGSLFEQFKKK